MTAEGFPRTPKDLAAMCACYLLTVLAILLLMNAGAYYELAYRFIGVTG